MPVMTPSVPQPAFRPGNSKASFMAAEPEQDQRASIDLSLPAYGNQPTDVKRGYGSFCPVSTNQDSGAVARDSEYYNDGVRTGKHSFESMRASTIPDEADFLKNDYMDRKSYLDNWPLKK
ncbi:hypothetical protein GGI04_004991 [Coemansia thaxteri]|nr:hypothetical protein GGI04_004991 [Coemansia thaxteri]KAJ2465306.1 hypothetical protein GGI02_004735 [Coemansia sp. RSA 2322]